MTVWFHPSPLTTRPPQLVIYADAGYSTLPNSSSVESFVISYGIPVSRDGIIQLKAHPAAWQARKMKRVARSSMAAESVALSTAIDFGYWIRAVYIEILLGSVEYIQFNALRHTPLVIPFDYEADLKAQYSPTSKEVFSNSPLTCWFEPTARRVFFSASGTTDEVGSWIPISVIHKPYQQFPIPATTDPVRSTAMIVLTDSATAFSDVHAGNPRCNDRLTRLRWRKAKGLVTLAYKLFRANACFVGFLTREETGEISILRGAFLVKKVESVDFIFMFAGWLFYRLIQALDQWVDSHWRGGNE